MELGMIGLGRMGANMTERLLHAGHRVVGYARSADSVQRVVGLGGAGATSLADVARQLAPPRVIWLMVPSGGPVDETID
ncbi:MAG: NAD(P)-binding domain-containing protein, partial [bacterium]